MLEKSFMCVYTKFKLQLYRCISSRLHAADATLTPVEIFCIEVIYALNKPTINAFADFMQISPPNAAYKVNNLIRKGYVRKVRSTRDLREYHLCVTRKYFSLYNLSTGYVKTVLRRMEKRFTQEELARSDRVLQIIAKELMPEIPPIEYRRRRSK